MTGISPKLRIVANQLPVSVVPFVPDTVLCFTAVVDIIPVLLCKVTGVTL